MKYFPIRYRLANGTETEWHQDIARFISALDDDPDLKGKISYRCMKMRDDSAYYHLAAAADDQGASLSCHTLAATSSLRTRLPAYRNLEVNTFH
jgi:hypothetical protein